MTKLYCVVAGGDSITGCTDCYPFQGLGITQRGDCTFPQRQATAVYTASGNIVFKNMGVSAQTLLASSDNMESVAETYADILPPLRALGPSSGTGGATRPTRKYIFSLLAGTNDGCTIGSPTSVANFVDAVVAFCAARKAAGFDKVILGTVLPMAVGAGSLTEANRTAYNSTLTGAGWAAANGIDGIFDLGGDAIMGDIATCDNLTYYDSSKVHPTTVGAAILAPIWKATLDAVIATL